MLSKGKLNGFVHIYKLKNGYIHHADKDSKKKKNTTQLIISCY